MFESRKEMEKVEILTGLPDKLLTDDEINAGMTSGYNTQGIFRYALPYWCARDFVTAKSNIAQRALRGQVTQEEVSIMNTDFQCKVYENNTTLLIIRFIRHKYAGTIREE
jgi:hypothetical protein